MLLRVSDGLDHIGVDGAFARPLARSVRRRRTAVRSRGCIVTSPLARSTAVEHSVEFQANMLRFMRQHNYTRVETRPECVAEWTDIVIKAAEPLLSSKVDSWQTGVNRNVEGRAVRRVLGYNGNGAHFRRKTDEVAEGGYQEFVFR